MVTCHKSIHFLEQQADSEAVQINETLGIPYTDISYIYTKFRNFVRNKTIFDNNNVLATCYFHF